MNIAIGQGPPTTAYPDVDTPAALRALADTHPPVPIAPSSTHHRDLPALVGSYLHRTPDQIPFGSFWVSGIFGSLCPVLMASVSAASTAFSGSKPDA